MEPDREAGGPAQVSSVIETALRWLAVRKEGEPLRFLRYALEDPASKSALAVRCLVEPAGSMPEATPESRALAVWGLIVDEIGKLGSAEDSRRRNTLMAAFRVPTAADSGWKATLDDRFRQLMGVRGVFGDPPPTTTTPMHQAWRRAVGKLAECLQQELELLRCDGRRWEDYAEIGRKAAGEPPGGRTLRWAAQYRAPSVGAQPVFVERMLVRVVMCRGRVGSRTTERDVIACEDGVDGFDVLATTGRTAALSELPVRAIWGCRLVPPGATQPGDPVMTRLGFGRALRRGERHRFISETRDNHPRGGRQRWVDVVVDHHGIAPGAVDGYGLPAAGLTMQIDFDRQCLPEACWWFAEQTDAGRRTRPPAGDPRLLVIGDGFVEHSFACPCQPRENYGISFTWPRERVEA